MCLNSHLKPGSFIFIFKTCSAFRNAKQIHKHERILCLWNLVAGLMEVLNYSFELISTCLAALKIGTCRKGTRRVNI